MLTRITFTLALAASLGATTAVGRLAGTGEIKLDTPNVTGTGPYTVVVKGTLSLDNQTTGFLGTSAELKGTLFTYNALVSLPKGNPKSDGVAVPVEYTWTLTNKGKYNGTVYLGFKDSNGNPDQTKATFVVDVK